MPTTTLVPAHHSEPSARSDPHPPRDGRGDSRTGQPPQQSHDYDSNGCWIGGSDSEQLACDEMRQRERARHANRHTKSHQQQPVAHHQPHYGGARAPESDPHAYFVSPLNDLVRQHAVEPDTRQQECGCTEETREVGEKPFLHERTINLFYQRLAFGDHDTRVSFSHDLPNLLNQRRRGTGGSDLDRPCWQRRRLQQRQVEHFLRAFPEIVVLRVFDDANDLLHRRRDSRPDGRRFPMGFSFGKNRRTKASLTIAMCGADSLSRGVNVRPATECHADRFEIAGGYDIEPRPTGSLTEGGVSP